VNDPRGNRRTARIYLAYALALLAGFILARIDARAFLVYLIAFFAFTGALPYLVAPVAKGEPGWMRHAFIKIAFPALAIVGIVLVVALIAKVGF
jgi:hypothetical protein